MHKGIPVFPITRLNDKHILEIEKSLQGQFENYFNPEEIEQLARVVVIGSKVEDELFGEDSALGKKIKIRDQNFREKDCCELSKAEESLVFFFLRLLSSLQSVGTVAPMEIDKYAQKLKADRITIKH